MMRIQRASGLGIFLTCTLLAACGSDPARDGPNDREAFTLEEASVAQIQRAFERGDLTARELVSSYLDRIARYDAGDEGLHAVLAVNAAALERAAELDDIYARTGAFVGPLHGIPILLKDNLDTVDQPTTAGCAALAESRPPDDAHVVQRLRAAGAVVLGKTKPDGARRALDDVAVEPGRDDAQRL